VSIASVTITSSREGLIGDALRSVVDWVDFCLIVDIGIEDGTLNVAREIVGDKLRVVKGEWPPVNGGFAGTRNFGLDEAAKLGADWACTLDTDERINLKGICISQELAYISAECILIAHESGSYVKERFIKLPALDRFSGDVHECIVPSKGRQATLDGPVFSEIPKTPEELAVKFGYLVEALQERTARDPDNPRLWYYLGDSLAGLGRDSDALKAFDRCAALRGWDEESAWACLRMAILLEKMNRCRDAVDLCAVGLARHAGIAELAWFAGEMSLKLGLPDQAIYWSRIAVANGTADGEKHFVRPRIGFRLPYGAKEGPFDLMERAYTSLGMAGEAQAARIARGRIMGGGQCPS
jgi:hypothetical protein